MNNQNDELKSLSVFIDDNIVAANKIISKIITYTIPVGFLLAIGHAIGLFETSYKFCIYTELCSILFTVILHHLTRYEKHKHLTKYVGLVLLSGYVSFLGCNSTVGIYMSYALVTFLSCIYLSKKTTIYTAIIGYFSMAFALYNRGNSLYKNIANRKPDLFEYFIPNLVGFTIEFIFVTIITIYITRQFSKIIRQIKARNYKIENIQNKLIQAFADTVEYNDATTGAHVKRTSEYVNIISHRLVSNGFYRNELTENTIEVFTKAAPLHDIGKFCIPNNILTKPGKYTDEEFELMKIHTTKGHEIIEKEFYDLENDDFVQIASMMAWCHHERFDGKGYPRGISGTDIPLCARIMAAADVLDALLSVRQYKKAFTLEETFKIFDESRDTQFENCIVDAVLSLEPEIRKIADHYNYNSNI